MHILKIVFLIISSFFVAKSSDATHQHFDVHSEDSKKHMKEEINKLDPLHTKLPDVEKVSAEEENNLWFSLHDLDGDGYLDGNEVLGAVYENESKAYALKEAVDYVDLILSNDDKNGDGKISYDEFYLSVHGN
jgi:Ca2+-binding EF-hand superfamily protein